MNIDINMNIGINNNIDVNMIINIHIDIDTKTNIDVNICVNTGYCQFPIAYLPGPVKRASIEGTRSPDFGQEGPSRPLSVRIQDAWCLQCQVLTLAMTR